MLTSNLHYGEMGSGKTAFGLSSFWDWKKGEPRQKDGKEVWGRWVRVGTEANEALRVPKELVRHFPFEKDPAELIGKVKKYLGAVAQERRKAEGPGYILFDGWTELGLGYINALQHLPLDSGGNKDVRKDYMAWKREYQGLAPYLHHNFLNCTVLTTARVSEPREEVKAGEKVTQQGDPEWVRGFKVFPSIEGREVRTAMFGYQFQMVVYHDTTSKTGTDQYLTYWLPHREFRVKNVYAHQWVEAGLKSPMYNVGWPEIEEVLEKL